MRDEHGVSTAIHCQGAVSNSNRLDRTSSTLKLPAVDATHVDNTQRRAGNGKISSSAIADACFTSILQLLKQPVRDFKG